MSTFHDVTVEWDGGQWYVASPTVILTVAERKAFLRFWLDGVM